jgi:hypothetical protein
MEMLQAEIPFFIPYNTQANLYISQSTDKIKTDFRRKKLVLVSITCKLLPVSSAQRLLLEHFTVNEPRHDNTNIVRLRQAWIQTSLRIRAV